MFLFNIAMVAAISSFTPGPNNAMLMQSGMVFGVKQTYRHIAGIVVGFNFLFVLSNVGVYKAIENLPVLNIIIKIVGTLYFMFLAYKMLLIKPTLDETPVDDVQVGSNKNASTDAAIRTDSMDGGDSEGAITSSDTTISPSIAASISPGDTITTSQAIIKTISKKPLGFWGAVFFQWINIKAWFYIISVIGVIPAEISMLNFLLVLVVMIVVTTASAFTWTLFGVYINKIFKNKIYIKIISILLAASLMYIGISQWFYS